MHRKIFSLRAKIEFKEMDNETISAAIHKKIVAIRPTADLKDANDELIARIKKKLLSFIRPKFWIEDPEGNKILIAQGKIMGWDFTVSDMNNTILAEISKTDRWRDIFLTGAFDFSDTYAVHVTEQGQKFDRRILLGLVVAIDNILHDKRK